MSSLTQYIYDIRRVQCSTSTHINHDTFNDFIFKFFNSDVLMSSYDVNISY